MGGAVTFGARRGHAGGQFLHLVRGTPLGEKFAPAAELHEVLVQLVLVHLHPGVEQLHAGLEGGAVEHGLGHALGHDLAVQVFHDEGTDGLLRQGKADLLAVHLPSKFESLSISVLEAMTLSKPVIVNGICDVLKGHCVKSNGGLYYKNFFEFEGCVNYLLEHTDVYEIMCKNARKYVEDYFQWEDIMKKFDDIIKLVGEKNEAENK